MRDPSHDILFEPVQVGPKTLKNRFYQVPQCTGFGVEKPLAQATFRQMKAEGGWALISTEAVTISPEADYAPIVIGKIWDDDDVRAWSAMTDAIHAEDSLAAIELWYISHGSGLENRLPGRGISTVGPWVPSMRGAYEMDKRELRELQQLYVGAAERACRAGFDVVNFYAGHSAIPYRFLMPFFNHRTDEYGGSFENRARFALETLELIREKVGDDCAVIVRLGIDSLPAPYGLGERGLHAAEDGVRFIEAADHLVDMWDVVVGYAPQWGEDAGPSRTHPENHEAAIVALAKQHSRKPVSNVGRFTNPDTMAAVVRSGQCDVIGAARASISDPFVPRKIEEGRYDDVRECIGCNMCVARYEQGGPIVCTQNATSGEEYRRGWHPERFARAANAGSDVLVVGGGPSGMECARVLGERGMRRVRLVEAAAELGGQMRWITKLPGLDEWGRVTTYREAQLAKLPNVEVILETEASAADVPTLGADIVVLATGAHWRADGLNALTHAPIPAEEGARVLTPEDVMLRGERPDGHVVVYDADGYFVGGGIADLLALEGLAVTLVTPFATLAPFMQYTLELWRFNRDLRAHGITVVTGHTLERVDAGSVELKAAWTDDRPVLDAGAVVFVTTRRQNDGLWQELRDGELSVYRIGDCLAPGTIADNVFSGHRLAREIDSPDPRVPLPYIRERALAAGETALATA